MKKLGSYTLMGILFGLFFPIFSFIFNVYVHNMDFSIESIWQIHVSAPFHWFIDMTPLLLGGVFHLLGIKALEHESKLKKLKPEESLQTLRSSEKQFMNAIEMTEWVRKGEELLRNCVEENKNRETLISAFISQLCLYMKASTTRLYVTDENEELCELQKYEAPGISKTFTSSLLLLPIRPFDKTVGILEMTSIHPFNVKEKQLIDIAIKLIVSYLPVENLRKAKPQMKSKPTFDQRLLASFPL